MGLESDRIPDRIDFPAITDSIVEAAAWAYGWAMRHDLGAETGFAMRLCTEEAVANIVAHAYDCAPSRGSVVLSATPSEGGACLIITDQGQPFDVAAAPDCSGHADILNTTIGGRGIRLIRGFAHRLEYARIGDSNQLTLSFIKAAPKPGM